MKKLIVLMLVLGLTSLASADLVLSINGEPAPDEYTLCPSDEIVIDVMLLYPQYNWAFDLAITLSNNQAALDSSGIFFPTSYDLGPGVVGTPTPQDVRVTAGMWFGPGVQGDAVLIDGVLLHCEEPTDVILELVVMGDTIMSVDGSGETIKWGTVLDSVIIHQVPEPATMLLLGLGGLLLRRRK